MQIGSSSTSCLSEKTHTPSEIAPEHWFVEPNVTAVYLDCNATAPLDPEVERVVVDYLVNEYGNAGSRTHEFGARAKAAVVKARQQVATVVGAHPEEVVFTSGATESNNLALLGLAAFGQSTGRRHLITTAIEHKAVLEPLKVLEERGFDVDVVSPTVGGWVEPDSIASRLRDDTLAVSVMHLNNETGVVQPISEIAKQMEGHPAFFHTDAAQSFGKILEDLRNPRIDLISVSGHKIYGPKGVGALVVRRRGFERSPLQPLMYGGGQERGLRPGTLPVHLIAGLGEAAKLAEREHASRVRSVLAFRERLLKALAPLEPVLHGDQSRVIPHAVNLSIPGVDAEAAMVALKGLIAISNGSACTSASYEPSHVLSAMRLSDDEIRSALRLSWCHLTEEPDWVLVVEVLAALR